MPTVDNKFRGLHDYRYESNPMEEKFALAWQEQNRGGYATTLEYLLGDGAKPAQVSDRDMLVAATVIQWLGSPVGQFFLAGVMKPEEVPSETP